MAELSGFFATSTNARRAIVEPHRKPRVPEMEERDGWELEGDEDAEAVLTRVLGFLGVAGILAVTSMAAMVAALVYVVKPWTA